jgi:hypothetical protein
MKRAYSATGEGQGMFLFDYKPPGPRPEPEPESLPAPAPEKPKPKPPPVPHVIPSPQPIGKAAPADKFKTPFECLEAISSSLMDALDADNLETMRASAAQAQRTVLTLRAMLEEQKQPVVTKARKAA